MVDTPTSFTGNASVESNYAIKTEAPVSVANNASLSFKTRMYVEVNDVLSVPENSDFEIDVDVNNVISCD